MTTPINIADFAAEFRTITGLTPRLSAEYRKALEPLVAHLAGAILRPADVRRREFLARVKWKFRMNAEPLAAFYAAAAGHGFTFHYHFKCGIQRAFDLDDEALLREVLAKRAVPFRVVDLLLPLFNPVSDELTVAHLQQECAEPNKLRREKGDRDIECEIVMAQFSAYMWVSLPERDMHRYFDAGFREDTYREHFWDELHARAPHLFNREHALYVARVTGATVADCTYVRLRDRLCAWLADSYEALNNHGFLALAIDPLRTSDGRSEWELACDISLFAEKHREGPLDKSYFRWQRVMDETCAYVPTVDSAAAHFNFVNEGFTYRDCFVITASGHRTSSIVLVFQKNERDETPVPCPACRSDKVQGNSYPSLGVRSWECENPLCPDRSKYNRGKRYSFKGLAMQRAIDDEHNEIPVDSVRQWSRDVVDGVDEPDLVDMLVRHYSMYGDTVHTFD